MTVVILSVKNENWRLSL